MICMRLALRWWNNHEFTFPAKSSLVNQGQGVLQASIQLVKASLQNGFFDIRRIIASGLTFFTASNKMQKRMNRPDLIAFVSR